MRKIHTLLVVLVLAALTSVGALAQLEDPEPAPDAAFVRIAHASAGTPAIKAFFDGTARISGLQYGSVTRWIDVAPGTLEIAIGTGSDPAAAQIPAFSLELEPGSFTTVAAVGSGDAIQGASYAEDYTRIRSGQARVTVLNALEGFPGTVDFTVSDTTLDFVSFPGSVASLDGWDTATVAPGTGVSVAGSNGVVIAGDSERTFEANHNYLVVASGTPDDARLTVVGTDQADFSTPEPEVEGEARFRIAHFSADTTPVTVFVDGTSVLSGLRYGFASRFLPIGPGTHEIAISNNSNIAAAFVGPLEVDFEDGGFTTIAVVGDGDGGATSVVISDFIAEGEDVASVTIYNGVAGGSAVDVWAGDTKLIEGLAFAGTFPLPAGGFNDGIAEAEVEPGTATVAVTPAFAASTEFATLTRETDFTAGNYYLIAYVGTADAPRLVVTQVDPAVDLTE